MTQTGRGFPSHTLVNEDVGMERRRLGRTRHDSSIAVLASSAFAACTEAQAAKTFDLARKGGVNHIDVDPGHGEAERLLEPLVAEHRESIFVGSGTHDLDPDDVKRRIDDTLGTLGLEEVDLYQLHGVDTPDAVDARHHAYSALDAARDAGLTGFIGASGHGPHAPAALLDALGRWDLDTVAFPLNARLWSIGPYRTAVSALLAECRARAIGVQVTNVSARGPSRAKPDGAIRYSLESDPSRIKDAIDFAMSIAGVHCLLTPDDRMMIGPTIEAADRPAFLSERRRREIVASFADDTPIFGPE